MPITGGYWRLCGIVGLACYTPDIATRALPCSSRCCQAQGHSRDDFRPRHPAAKLYPGYFEPSGIIAERETKRVHTEVWLVEQPTGGFTYLTAGIDATGQEVVSGTARVRGQFQQDYAGRSEPLPVVAITDGARTIRRQLAELFDQPVPVILDWYHLDKKVGELMGMAARTKQEKADHVAHLLNHLWHGRPDAALTYLRRDVQAKNPEPLATLMTYLEKHREEIIDYGRRQRAGKPIGSGRMEKGVDQVIGARQKHKGMSWSPTGSKALGILKVVELNQQWAQLWFPQQAAA